MSAAPERRNRTRPSFRDALPPPGPRNGDSSDLVPLNVRVHAETKRLIKVAAVERGEKVQDLADQAIRAYLQT